MHNNFKELTAEDDVILLEDTLFNPIQIRNKITKDFEPKGNDLNFCCKNPFIKKYFRLINVHGIFNRLEWKFSLKHGIKCELLMPGNNVRQKGRLEIRIILEFSPSRKQVPCKIDDIISNQIKVSLDFCPDEPDVKEIPTLNDICRMVEHLQPAKF